MMAADFPEKDVQVAFRLLEKLTHSRDAVVQTRDDYEAASDAYDKNSALKSTRTSYMDILEEIAEAVGETVEPEDHSELAELERKVSEAKTALDTASKEYQRLRALAEKLRSQAPKLWSLAEDKFGRPVDIDYGADSQSDEETDIEKPGGEDEVNVVDRILNWKSDAPPAAEPESSPAEPFELASFFNMQLLEGARFQNRIGDARLVLVF